MSATGPKATVRGVSLPANLISARASVVMEAAGRPWARRSERASASRAAMRSVKTGSETGMSGAATVVWRMVRTEARPIP